MNVSRRVLVGLLFALYVSLGVLLFRDYGLSWDEGARRGNGIEVLRYVLHGDLTLLTDRDRYNVGFFEVILVGLEYVLNLRADSRATFYMRHLVSYLFFCLGLVFFYRLCRYRGFSWKWGLLGSLFLFLSPRIFADAFYNSSDIPLLVMCIVGMYTLMMYLDSKTLAHAALHALTSALVVNTRLVGIFILFLTMFFLAADAWILKDHDRSRRLILISGLVYFSLTTILFVLVSPSLWENPPQRFLDALEYMRTVPWGGKVLYMGRYMKDTELPWHYAPVWIAISTPVLYIALFITGCMIILKRVLSDPLGFYRRQRMDIVMLSWFFLPLGGVIAFRPGLYDGWRHLFYIYPALLFVVLVGLKSLLESSNRFFASFNHTWARMVPVALVAPFLLHTVYVMITYHPYQNVYFNRLAGRDMREIKGNFELDYWGLSYRKALEYILKHDPDPAVRVYVANQPGKENAKILTSAERSRLEYVESPEEADYFLSNYRWHKDEYPYDNEFYSIQRGGAKIMVVYKLR